MNLRVLQHMVQELRGESATTIDRVLKEHRLSAEERVCVRHMMAAASTQEQLNEMRAAAGEAPQPANHTQRLLTRAGFRLGKWYSSDDVNRLLTQAGYGTEDRLACRIELESLGMTGEFRDGGHQLHASAARPGRLLVDRQGRPVTIRAEVARR
jgi:hypothetical protein